MNEEKWEFWIDRGGTFTDVVGRRPDGSLVMKKLLSDNPGVYDDAAVQGMRELLAESEDCCGMFQDRVSAVKMGTTVATNALLERRGDRTLLVITRGFADALRIGYQERPRLFQRRIVLPELLYERVEEVDERVSAGGEVLVPVDLEGLRPRLQQAFYDGIYSVAIVCLHGYAYPEHEKQIASLARETGFTQISVSHATSSLIKLVSRGDTTVVDAYLSPVLRRYVNRISAETGKVRLQFMQSNGGLTGAHLFQGKDAILSGPAGGIAGAVKTAEQAGFTKIITFDMGGTSTDVAHYSGEYERTFETQVAGVRLRAPMMQIHTVAAGGGSICRFDGARFRVGPESAGAHPGPACYGKGGPLTVTDCNVMLGKLQPDFFPRVFGPGQNESLDEEVVRKIFTDLAGKMKKPAAAGSAAGDAKDPLAVAEGFLMVAVENMANAIKKVSVQRGYDVTGYTLVCFGGAGGQHACLVADALGINKVLLHPFAGVLSAYGMGMAEVRAMREQTLETPLEESAAGRIKAVTEQLAAEARRELLEQNEPAECIELHRKVHIRYEGSDISLPVPLSSLAEMAVAFNYAYRDRFGFVMGEKPLVASAVELEAVAVRRPVFSRDLADSGASGPPVPAVTVQAYMAGATRATPVYRRKQLSAGHILKGPAIVVEETATTVIEPGWQGECTRRGDLLLSRKEAAECPRAMETACDPVMLEVFNNLFMSVAGQMGYTLQNTAFSVNIKERLDFSCAVFDGRGRLIANAPHIPVHLGSMGESVRAVIRSNRGKMCPGDVYALNAPYNGGTHLPDVTVVTPVFDDDNRNILFYVGSRGHHADIGGITPGSMPSHSRTVEEEGVLIDNFRLVEKGILREEAFLDLLLSGEYPARNPRHNLADVQAQIAANAKGIKELRKMVSHYGAKTVQAYMEHVRANAEESVRRVIDVLKEGKFTYPMDDGAVVSVRVSIHRKRRQATVDFSGSSPQQQSNFNAPLAVCRAAVLYVFRTLIEDEIPMNEGCLKPINLIVPEGSMLNPVYPAAVVAGNVETSQVITDALYGALGIMAASQGTMNNTTFGNARYQYYETVCGGSGAGPDFNGTSAVHTHMTNSRLTDPEVLELRFPVRVESFEIRAGSGGRGRYRGGDGVRRRLRFLEDMEVVILANHRRVQPFGLAGGSPAALGRNYVERTDGTVEQMTATDSRTVRPGDVFVLETPGGGGYGNVQGDVSLDRYKNL